MTEGEKAELIRHLRDQARGGASGTDIVRALRARPGMGLITICQLAMDAFGMGLRDARSCEYLLADEREGANTSLDADWRPFLSDPEVWPNRVVRLEIQETGEAHFEVTLRLFEYSTAHQDETVLLSWGDGTRSESRTGGLPVSHRYEAPGVYLFECQIPGFRWTLRRTLQLELKQAFGTTGFIYPDPW